MAYFYIFVKTYSLYMSYFSNLYTTFQDVGVFFESAVIHAWLDTVMHPIVGKLSIDGIDPLPWLEAWLCASASGFPAAAQNVETVERLRQGDHRVVCTLRAPVPRSQSTSCAG